MSDLPPHGVQGFESAEAAIAHCRNSIRVNDPLKFAVMRSGDNYAWVFPVSHAERIARTNGVEIVSVQELKPLTLPVLLKSLASPSLA